MVSTSAALAPLVDAIKTAPVVAFDTEFVGEHSYEPQLCLIQLATSDATWIVDPLAGLDLSALWLALTAPGREVVALAARQEILFCLRYAHRPPSQLFDPQLAAGLVGLGYPLSHTNLVRKVLDINVPAGETFTDWRKRPLTARQIEYAAADVQHLLEVRRQMLDRAERMNRVDWLTGECAGLVERVVKSEDEERWWRVSGATSLNRRGLGVLRELWRWRDTTARTADVPPRRVLGDEIMVEVAKRSPSTVDDLFALRGLERGSLRKAGGEMVAAVKRGMDLPSDQLPDLRRRDDPPQVSTVTQVVSVVANSLAARHQVDPALLATTANLQELVRWRLGAGEPERPAVLDGWRGEILGRPLLDLLDGRSIIRITDLKAPDPVRIEPRNPIGDRG
ncbi:MAG: ribonuclease D [Dehalococcoidia bacterium]|nr:ribonuclease D [Dehalococcoidia bacterium]